MQTQPNPMHPRRLARSTDPGTSKAAALRVAEFVESHHTIILDALRTRPAGLTVHEIAELCPLAAHAVGKRISELESLGLIAPAVSTGTNAQLTRRSPSGRPARVWRLPE